MCEARLQYLKVQDRERREKEQAARLAAESPAERQERARRAAVAAVEEVLFGEETSSVGGGSDSDEEENAAENEAEPDKERVTALLNLLAERLVSQEGNHMEGIQKLLCTVLSNAATKGQNDAKYLRLKASNDKLWATLRHPEVVAILAEAGWWPQQQQPEAEAVQAALRQQLEGSEPADAVQVDALVRRLEQLHLPPHTVDEGLQLLLSRDAQLVHPGPAVGQALGLVLQAATDWQPPGMGRSKDEATSSSSAG